MALPAGGTVDVEGEVKPAGDPGPFRCPVYVTYHDGDYQDLALTVRGTWVQSGDTHDDAPKP